MASPAVQNAIDSVAAVRGITQSYVDFTTKLVTDVMNALVSSAISQMRAYTDLVSQLERGLAVFKANVTTPQAIITWLESRVPETGTDSQRLAVSTAALSQNSATVIANLYSQKLVSILGAPSTHSVPGGNAGVEYALQIGATAPTTLIDMTRLAGQQLDVTAIPNASGVPTAKDYTDPANGVPSPDTHGNIIIDLPSAIVTTMADDATSSYQQLDTLVRMGMIRVVATDGFIDTKMTFQMSTADASQRNSQDIYGSSFAASASAGAGWGWGSASMRASYSNFNVHLADEHAQTSTEIQVAMMGEVRVNYKSDYFPQLPSQQKP